ncbi:hypothetical protein NL490_27655, partial [Klebsiella pneumoniae]|nr:hypothetical protein [Klebsiella pneumoniae]
MNHTISHQGDNIDHESRIATDEVHLNDTAPRLSTSIAPGAFDSDDIQDALAETSHAGKETVLESQEQAAQD